MELVATHQARRLEPGQSLAEITEQVREASRGHHDRPGVRLSRTRLEEDGYWRFQGEAGRLSRLALSQLCARLPLPGGGGVPARYLARCPAPLAAANLNHWLDRLAEGEHEALVRLCEAPGGPPLVRAVLTDRYAAADHLPLLETLMESTECQGLALRAWSLDDEQMTLRLVADADHPASLRDPLRIGVHIANSEVGLGRVSVQALVTRLVCSNGLVVKVADLGGVQRRHVGRAQESLETVIRLGIGTVLKQADQAARRFVRLRGLPAPQPVERYLERTAREAELPEELTPLVASRLEGDTLYDVVNAFTQAAQQLPVAERLRIETHMSHFLQDRHLRN